MKKNLQLTVLALALCCVTVNAQNAKTVGSKQPILSNTTNNQAHNHNGNSETTATSRYCGTEVPHGEWDNWTKEQLAELEKINYNIGPYDASKQQMVPYTIPIIFHIVHGGTAVGAGINISQAQIADQLTILNNDMKSAGFNSALCPSYFLPVKSDVELTFCLATRNPTGGILAEPGIDRRAYTSITGLAAPGAGYNQPTCDGTIKPQTIWDPIRYCNVWVTQLSGGLLGYATFPIGTSITCITGNGSATTDGVVNGYQYVGSIGSASLGGVYNRGRTLVHELGHWLGLRHINGDGGCTASDCVTDTPPQEALHGGCPSSASPYHIANCATGPNGEMFMNYMDYTDDACMYMWSAGQKVRIQQCMVQGTYRNQLTASASTLCVLTATAPSASVSIASAGCAGAAITTTNSSTGVPTPTYIWSTLPAAGVTYNPNNTAVTPTITFPSAANYTVTCMATNSLGSNSNSKVISITNCAAICVDTLMNVQPTATLNLATAGTDTSVPGCSPKAGYIFGSNCYDDLEKAEYFTQSMYATIATPKITGAIVLFYKDGTKGTGGNVNTPVNLKLYNGTMASGPTATTVPIGTATANIGTILGSAATNSVNYCGQPGVVYVSNMIIPYKYTFTTNPAAPATNGFFASVQTPTASGDTAVVWSDNTLAVGTNWELWSPNGWFNVSPTWGGFDASMAILPIISCSVSTGVTESEFAANINLMPNPTTGIFNIVTTLPNVKNIHLTVTNAIGQQITTAELSNVTNGVFTVDLSTYNNGVYFITLQSNGEKVVKRIILSK